MSISDHLFSDLWVFLGNAYALTIEFKNDTREKYIYNFYWIDNPYAYGKMAMGGGELQSDQSNTIQDEYSPGKYYLIWFQRNSTPDDVIIIPFTEEFAQTSSEDFIKRYLVEKTGVKKLIVGYDHHFGKNREGNHQKLINQGKQYGFEVEEVPAQYIGDIAVSSTKIRNSARVRWWLLALTSGISSSGLSSSMLMPRFV